MAEKKDAPAPAGTEGEKYKHMVETRERITAQLRSQYGLEACPPAPARMSEEEFERLLIEMGGEPFFHLSTQRVVAECRRARESEEILLLREKGIGPYTPALISEGDLAIKDAEIAAWKDRFRAIVGEDSPDAAGNAVIALRERVAACDRGLCAGAAAMAAPGIAAVRRAEQAEADRERLRELLAKVWSAFPPEIWAKSSIGTATVVQVVAALGEERK